jgi:predicted nucleic acid-binding Zn ribbon protein
LTGTSSLEVADLIEKLPNPENPRKICYRCIECGYTKAKLQRLMNHVESRHHNHKGIRYRCEYCGSRHKTKNAMTTHVSMWHREQHAQRKMGKQIAASGIMPAEEMEAASAEIAPDVAILQPSSSIIMD